MSIKEASQFCEKHELLSKIQELEKEIEHHKQVPRNLESLHKAETEHLNRLLARSIPRKSKRENLDDMWPTFVDWYQKYIGEDLSLGGNYSFSREDMRYAFQAGCEIHMPTEGE